MSYIEPLQLSLRFGDNDFYSTFVPLMEYIGKTYQETGIKYTFEQYAKIFNELSFGFYLLHQNKFKYNESKSVNTKNYLTVAAESFSFDIPIEWNNHETFTLYVDENNIVVKSV